MKKEPDYLVRAADSLSFEAGSDLIDTNNPIDVNWSCRVGIKKKNAAAFLTDRAETTTNADNTRYVVSLTSLETDITPGEYLIVVRLSNATLEYQKTVSKILKVEKKLFT